MDVIVKVLRGIRQRLAHLFDALKQNQMLLRKLRKLDEQLVRLSRVRERRFALLADAYIRSEHSHGSSAPFRNVVNQIDMLEQERELLGPEPPSLTELIVPKDEMSDTNQSRELDLIDGEEQQERVRKRLRALYLDLGELLYKHPILSYFQSQSDEIASVQSRLQELRAERAAVAKMMPTSQTILFGIKVFLGLVVVIFVALLLV